MRTRSIAGNCCCVKHSVEIFDAGTMDPKLTCYRELSWEQTVLTIPKKNVWKKLFRQMRKLSKGDIMRFVITIPYTTWRPHVVLVSPHQVTCTDSLVVDHNVTDLSGLFY